MGQKVLLITVIKFNINLLNFDFSCKVEFHKLQKKTLLLLLYNKIIY